MKKSKHKSKHEKKDKKRKRSSSSSRSLSRHRKQSSRSIDRDRKKKMRKQKYFSSPSIENNKQQNKNDKLPVQSNVIVEEIVKEEINFEPTGILAKYSNALNGVTIKFSEPLDAKNPDKIWRLYPFKGQESFSPIQLKNKSAFLIGKDDRIADIFLENLSCSSQHAVIQFREKQISNVFGDIVFEIKPYIMDLESTNGTTLNGEMIETSRYYELLNKDVIRFRHSERDYVFLQEQN